MLPLSPEQIARLQAATTDFNPTQLAWLSGYFWGMVNQAPGTVAAPAPVAAEVPGITLISASQTGNARRLAEQLRDDLLAAKLSVNLVNAGDYKFKQIGQEKLLVIVTSTQGEGEPPEEAVALHKFLLSKKAPKLSDTAFAVFGLGDTSYEFFSQAGKDFDQRLAELGGERLLDRVDADVEYSELASARGCSSPIFSKRACRRNRQRSWQPARLAASTWWTAVLTPKKRRSPPALP